MPTDLLFLAVRVAPTAPTEYLITPARLDGLAE